MLARHILFLAANLLLLAGIGSSARWGWFLSTPLGPFPAEGRRLLIAPGTTGRETAQLLEKEGIIGSARLFSWLLRQQGAASSVKAGWHTFRGSLVPIQVIEILIRAEVEEVSVTIPEGLTMEQTAQSLADAGLGSTKGFLEVFRDPRLIQDLAPGALDLEGYLFPDTYRFNKGEEPARIAEIMVANFRRRFAIPQTAQIAASGKKMNDLVTLASLVEKETAVAAERPAVAGVYVERLRRGMRLQCDPTVIFALQRRGDWDGNLRRDDLVWDHPYNTYTRSGLPPGPIASPGEASLLAALSPLQDGFLYFVARGDGTHEFSRTLREHNQAVNRYQRLTR